jgi:hypothetical protein
MITESCRRALRRLALHDELRRLVELVGPNPVSVLLRGVQQLLEGSLHVVQLLVDSLKLSIMAPVDCAFQ